MKEIGIEKLIELLNEYNEIHNYAPIEYYDDETNGFETNYVAFYKTCIIISKQFGFIKWLVENKKFKRYSAYKNLLDGDYVKFGSNGPVIPSVNGQLYDSILCGLAISDEPIELLISILK